MLNVVNDQSLKYLRRPLCIWRATAHAHTHWMRVSLRKCTSCLVLASDTQTFLSKSICFCCLFFWLIFILRFSLEDMKGALFPRFVSDLNRSKVRSKVRDHRTTCCSDPKQAGGSGAHPLIPGEAPFAVLSPIDNYIGYY